MPQRKRPRWLFYQDQFHGLVMCMMIGSLLMGCTSACPHAFDESPLRLPLPRVADNTFVLDIAFFRVACDEDVEQQLWAEIDEQAIDAEVRRGLLSEGIRCGLVEASLPKGLEEILVTNEAVTTPDATASQPDSGASDSSFAVTGPTAPEAIAEKNRRIYLRPGKRAEIVTSSGQETTTVLRRTGDGVSGTTYQDARAVFQLTVVDTGCGEAIVSLTPEIQHGQPKKRFIGSDGSFRLAAAQERELLDQLILRARMSVGQTLVVSCTTEALTVGANFFECPPAATQKQRKLLLIRLTQSSLDRLYENRAKKRLSVEDL